VLTFRAGQEDRGPMCRPLRVTTDDKRPKMGTLIPRPPRSCLGTPAKKNLVGGACFVGRLFGCLGFALWMRFAPFSETRARIGRMLLKVGL